MRYININQKLKFKFCQVPRKILYTEPYKSILCPLSQLGYIFILDRLNLSRMNNKVLEFLQPNKIYKNKINNSNSTKIDYSDFDWISVYANKF